MGQPVKNNLTTIVLVCLKTTLLLHGEMPVVFVITLGSKEGGYDNFTILHHCWWVEIFLLWEEVWLINWSLDESERVRLWVSEKVVIGFSHDCFYFFIYYLFLLASKFRDWHLLHDMETSTTFAKVHFLMSGYFTIFFIRTTDNNKRKFFTKY